MENTPNNTRRYEDVAVIGMSGRFPGANNVDEFWQNLKNGVEGVVKFSDEELIATGIDPRVIAKPNYVKANAPLKNITDFDADFFGMTAHEAAWLDPQQRILLECAWEALENAGYSSDYNGIIGVFASARLSEYLISNLPIPDMHGFDDNSGLLVTNWKMILDNDKDTLATRLSYKLDLKGPSVTIQTACSSSLVATHLACRSLFDHESDIILAGGICIRVPQKSGYLFNEGMIFSPDGHTRAFSADGEGTIFSSGAGIVVLKLLDRALEDGDTIRAVIKGSAINNDGKANKGSYTAPSAPGQSAVLLKALEAAGTSASTLSYIEAHGTATIEGDVTEMNSLIDAFRKHTPKKQFCSLGSVKTNIGHPTQAAGVIGLIKTILMLESKTLVPHLHFDKPNPKVDFENSPFIVNTKTQPWDTNGDVRRAGINSFGVGGTNVHVVVEEAPPQTSGGATEQPSAELLVISARTADALNEIKNNYVAYLDSDHIASLGDICNTAAQGRKHFNERAYYVARDKSELREQLLSPAQPTPLFGTAEGKTVFLFSGQGTQYAGMGKELYEKDDVFRQVLDECNDLLRPYLNTPLLDVLFAENEAVASRLKETLYTQTALFSLEYALYRVWKSLGITPDYVIGHSVGEFVAAVAAGILSFEDGVSIIATRAQLMQELPSGGAMAVIHADENTVAEKIGDHAGVAIAAINGPEKVVISGTETLVQELTARFELDEISVQRLQVSHAFHSPMIEPMMDAFYNAASQVTWSPPREAEIICNISGQFASAEFICNADYWTRHLRATVKFRDSIHSAINAGATRFVELGPASALLAMARQCCDKKTVVWLPSLNKTRSDKDQLLSTLGGLYASGEDVNWAPIYSSRRAKRVPLPTYPFQRQRHWVERNATQAKIKSVPVSSFDSLHPLLGRHVPSAHSGEIFENQIRASTEYLADHHMFGNCIFPGTGYMELARAAAFHAMHVDHISIEDMMMKQPLILSEDQATRVQTILTPDGDDYEFGIYSQAENSPPTAPWECHVRGRLSTSNREIPHDYPSFKIIQAQDWIELRVDILYLHSEKHGVVHGPNFQAFNRLWRSETESLAEIRLPERLSADGYLIHPVMLDACLYATKAASPGYDDDSEDGERFIPAMLDCLEVYGDIGTACWSYARMQVVGKSSDIRSADIFIYDHVGEPVALMRGLHFKCLSADAEANARAAMLNKLMFKTYWKMVGLPDSIQAIPQKALIFAHADNPLARSMLDSIENAGGQACLVSSTPNDDVRLHADPYSSEDANRAIEQMLAEMGHLDAIIDLRSLESRGGDSAEAMLAQPACAGALHLLQALTRREDNSLPKLCLVTKRALAIHSNDHVLPESSALWGLGRVAAREHGELPLVMIDLPVECGHDEARQILREVIFDSAEHQVALREGKRFVARMVACTDSERSKPLDPPTVPVYQLRAADSALLEDLDFVATDYDELGDHEIEVNIQATGLNFRDVLGAIGKYPNAGSLGREFAGIVCAVGDAVTTHKVGDNVFGMASGSLANRVRTPDDYAVSLPEGLDYEDAATIPIAYLTVYHGLCKLSQLKKVERVLIHAAAGGVGFAAMQYVNAIGGEIYATASKSKWDYLKAEGVKYIYDSRSLEFESQIMADTNGEGVDIVLNALSGDFIQASVNCLGKNGRFIELGKDGIWDPAQMAEQRPDVSYYPFDLGTVAQEDSRYFQSILLELTEMFRKHKLSLPPQKCYPLMNAVEAFRFMAQAKHVGKIVLSQERSPSQHLRKQGCFLITGGLGGLGLELAKWLNQQNAAHIVLLGRSHPSAEAREVIASIESNGSKVHTVQCDVANIDSLKRAFDFVDNNLPRLRGVIHAAGILDDGAIRTQNWSRFQSVMAAKIAGGWNLHRLTKKRKLDFFVLFSSISAYWGTPGQSNYAAANAFLDGLAHYRNALQLPAKTVNWGSWASVGMATLLRDHIQEQKKKQGLGVIEINDGMTILGRLINSDNVQTVVVDVDYGKYVQQLSSVPPLFQELATKKVKSSTTQNDKPKVLAHKLEGLSVEESRQMITTFCTGHAAKILGVSDPSGLDINTSLFDYGLDSLSAVELSNLFELALGQRLPVTLLHEKKTLANLIEDFLVRLGAADANEQDMTSKRAANARTAKSSASEEREMLAPSGSTNGPISIQQEDDQGRRDTDSTNEAEYQIDSTRPCVFDKNKVHRDFLVYNNQGNKPPLFSFHIPMLDLQMALGDEQPHYYFKSHWRQDDLPDTVDVVSLATEYVEQICRVQSKGPYYMAAYSMGALFAFEAAQQLQSLGEEVAYLYLLEPITPLHFEDKTLEKELVVHRESIKYEIVNVLGRSKSVLRKIARLGAQSLSTVSLRVPGPLSYAHVRELYHLACHGYLGRVYNGSNVFLSKVRGNSTVDVRIWNALVPNNLTVMELSAVKHLELLEDTQEWVQQICIKLNEVQRV
jgi:acyl transferase domain-containing protein/acyl carrier protein